MSEIEVVVSSKAREALEICSLELARRNGDPLPPFTAGAHIDVHLPGGLVRQYSLCNHPSEQHRYLIGVLREPASRGGSVMLHDAIKPGDALLISAPRNYFPLARARHTVLLAGGIGITPLLCMAERLAETSASFELHYCARSEARAAFAPRIRGSRFASRVAFHFDDGADEQKLAPLTDLPGLEPGVHLYVCGPAGFMAWIIGAAQALGWPEGNIHREYFAGTAIDTSQDRAFQVRIASSGRVVTIPADRRVTDVLREAGVEIPTSCEEGVCGTCLTRVLEGKIDHRDMFLLDSERTRHDQFAPCVSRAISGLLVLDL